MPKVAIKNKEIQIDRKRVPLISGEMHYWRLSPQYWKRILAEIRNMGLKVVSTYVPWHYHEYEKGKFDFTGKTEGRRDLKKFLELTRREGFWVVIRPGPYIYSEWPNDGVPNYAHEYHRLHPQFLKFASNYLERVMKIISPFMATRRRGHVILLQADNEIDPWPDLFGQQYGLNQKPGLFQDFIRDLYSGDVHALNEAWGTRYKDFSEAGPYIATMLKEHAGLPLKGDRELKRNLDYFRFKYDYSQKYADWSVKAYRKLGVDVPIYLNVYPFFYAHDWMKMQEVSDMVGLDIYPTSEFAEDEFEQRKFMDKIRFLKNTSKIPFIAEFASGVWHNRHYETGVLTPNHYRLIGLSAIMSGAAGWNWYMLVNRDNWYMSPINEWGQVRPELYEIFKQMVAVYNRMHPPSLEKVTEIAATFNTLQYAARTMSHNSPILVSLYNADIDYELYDMRTGACDKKFMFYSGNQWLDIPSQKNLRHYVERGGTLIAFRNYPRKDEAFEPCSVVGFEDPKSILFEFKRQFDLQLAPGRKSVTVNSSVFCFRETRDMRPIRVDFGPFGKNVVGYVKKIGKGRLVHLGVEPSKELILEVLDFLKVNLASRAVTKDVKTALFRRGKKYYLVAVNNGSEDKSASVHLPGIKGSLGKMNIYSLMGEKPELHAQERRMSFSFEIPRKDGLVFELRSSGG